jgi:hypothetical protein
LARFSFGRPVEYVGPSFGFDSEYSAGLSAAGVGAGVGAVFIRLPDCAGK